LGGWGVAYSVEFVRHGLLGRDVTYSGTDLPTFWRNSIASPSLVEIYQLLEARSVSCIRYREYVGGTVQRSGENFG